MALVTSRKEEKSCLVVPATSADTWAILALTSSDAGVHHAVHFAKLPNQPFNIIRRCGRECFDRLRQRNGGRGHEQLA